MADIVSLNNLEQQQNGVFRISGAEQVKFGYSDGAEEERHLDEILERSEDLCSRSPELQSAIRDWPSEYHLSSDRANLLLGFDLSGVRTALELGSGCGAISRYLGDLGISVDAVEGSPTRAALGRKRCRDLENVRVICANYNDLEVPVGEYDLVILVGVIEYASKFQPGSESDYKAARDILTNIAATIRPDGVAIVAIENRLGLKYILGLHEDHYQKRYIGIHGYRDSAGIATYSEKEWDDLVNDAGFNASATCYPFPDYKIPRVMLSRDFARSNRFAYNHLEGVFARDYTVPVKRTPTEQIAWEAASQGGFLNQIANSFCLVLGHDEAAVRQLQDFDFCHLPSPARRNEFAMVTRKPAGRDIVEKVPVFSRQQPEDGAISQVISEQPFFEGSMLSSEWLRAILIYSRREEFDALVSRYYDFLGEIESSGGGLKIDMLPINIIVDSADNYQLFDQEWEVDWKIEKEYLLFRALLTFIVTNWIYMKDFLGWLELYTVRDFVEYGFRNHRLLPAKYFDRFIELENRFQQSITYQADERRVEGLLDTVFDFTSDDRSIYATLFFKSGGAEFEECGSVEVTYEPGPEYQELRFCLPDGVTSVTGIRLDPFDIRKTDRVGFFSVSDIGITDAEGNYMWRLTGEQEIAAASSADSCWFESLGDTGYWLSATDFPKIEIDLSGCEQLTEGMRYHVRVNMRATESQEYILAQQRYLVRSRQQEQLEADLRRTLHHLDSARTEIANIKAGKPFRLGMKIFSMLSFIKR